MKFTMTSTQSYLTTTAGREYNPKAVFIGTETGIIEPIKSYLFEHGVEVSISSLLTDFGKSDYFFYVGDGSEVKEFIVQRATELPKTLIMLLKDSVLTALLSACKHLTNIKIVSLNGNTRLSPSDTNKIINFFLGSPDNLFQLPNIEKNPEDRQTIATFELKQAGFDLSKEAIDKEIRPVETPASLPVITASVPQKKSPGELESPIASFYRSQPKSTYNKPGSRFRYRIPLLSAALLTIFLLVGVPLLLTSAFTLTGAYFVRSSYEYVIKSDLIRAESRLNLAEQALVLASSSHKFLGPLYLVAHQQEKHQGILQLLNSGTSAIKGTRLLIEAADDGRILLEAITGKAKGIALNSFATSLKSNLIRAETELALVEAQLKTSSVKNTFGAPPLIWVKSALDNSMKKLQTARIHVATARQLSVLMPDVLGFYGKRTFLVIFQNNMELRPTGGFIGSYGLLTFDGGALKDFQVEDIYTADGALKGHVDPPSPISTYLGEEHWYMRDSNWDPDFSHAARQLLWFIDKELDIKPDGVIAMDLTAAQYILEIVGRVELVDYNETITPDNMYPKLQAETQKDFFPGSTKKKDYLGSFARALMTRIFEEKSVTPLALMKKTHQALEERHLMAYFVKPDGQRLVEEYGWGGNIRKTARCDTGQCFNDYLMVVDANMGVNKVNYFVERIINDTITIDEQNFVSHELRITYKNNSPSNHPLGGPYKNYVRAYVAGPHELVRADIDSSPLTIEVESPVASASSVTTGAVGNLRVFSSFLEVAPQKEKTLTLIYKTLEEIPSKLNNFSYIMQKQPGTIDDKISVDINYPPQWQVVDFNGEQPAVAGASSLVKRSRITYNSPLVSDIDLNLKFR